MGCELAQEHRIDRGILGSSGLVNFYPELEGASFSEMLDSIAAWRDWAVQTVTGESLSQPPLDDYERGLELASVANLVDIAVHRVLAAEIRGWQKITEEKRSEHTDS